MTLTSSVKRCAAALPLPRPQALAPQMWRISDDEADASRP